MKTKTVTRISLLSLLILSIFLLALALAPCLFAGSGAQEGVVAQAEGEDTPVISMKVTTRDKFGYPTSPDNNDVLRGKYFDVAIVLSNNVKGLTGLELLLDYDPAVMTLDSYGLIGYTQTPDNEGDYADILQGADGNTQAEAEANSALMSIGLSTSEVDTADKRKKVHPLQLLWIGVEPDYTEGTLATLRFKSVSSSNSKLLGEKEFSLSYNPINTYYTTPKSEGGRFTYQQVRFERSYVNITAGKYQCTYYDYAGKEIVHYEENDYSLFTPEEPALPDHPSTRTYYFTKKGWSASLGELESTSDEAEGVFWEITAQYDEHAQPYTVYYYFGNKDPETGVITIEETPDYYYYTLDGNNKIVCEPKSLFYREPLPTIARYTEAYYSLSKWYLDAACTQELKEGLVPEDKSVDEDYVAAQPCGVPLENTFSLKLFAYREHNEDVVPPDQLDAMASTLKNVVTVEGTTVTVKLELTQNFGIMSMNLALEYDECLTFVGVDYENAVLKDYWTTGSYVPTEDFRLAWKSKYGNFYVTGIIATLTFTLDSNADVGDHLVTVTYAPKQDVTRYFDATNINGNPEPEKLWYTILNVVDGYVTVAEVNAPEAQAIDYTFNKTEQTFAFVEDSLVDLAHYTIKNNKRTEHGTQTVTVSLKGRDNGADVGVDNVYRFWKAEEGRPRNDLTFTFSIAKKSVKIPVASSTQYVYDGTEQTYAFLNAGDVGYYSAEPDSFLRTVKGSQTITCVLAYPTESYWGEDEEDVDDKEYTFTILPFRVQRPTSKGKTYVYDTTEQTFEYNAGENAGCYEMAENANKRTLSGSQPVTFTLKDPNYCWDVSGDPTDPFVLTFTIDRAPISAPGITADSYVYTGTKWTYTFSSETQANKDLYYTVSGNEETDAGNYTVVVALKNTTDTYWAGDPEDVANKEYPFVIQKKTVTAPTPCATTFTFDVSGNDAVQQTYAFAAENTEDKLLYEVNGALTKSASGTTYITVSLKDSKNYKWSTTGLSDNLSYPFTINQKAVKKPTPNTVFTYEYTGESQTFVLKDTDEKKFYTITDNSRTDAGTYDGDDAVKIAFKFKNDCYWQGSDPHSNADLSYAFVISKKQIVKPRARSGIYVYDKTEQTFDLVGVIENASDYYSVSNDKRTLAGHQLVSVSLIDKKNCAWKPVGDESVSSNDLTFDFDILKQEVSVPENKKVNGSPKVYVFTGSEIQAEFQSALKTDLYDVIGDKQTASGEYEIVFKLKDKANYCWKNTDLDEDQSIPFVIRKRVVQAPTANQFSQTVTYDGSAHAFVFTYEDPDAKDVYYTCTVTYVKGENDPVEVSECKNAGTYTYTFALKYKSDTYWSTDIDDVADKNGFTLTIQKKSVPVISIAPKTWTGEPLSPDVPESDDYTVAEVSQTDKAIYPVLVTLKSDNLMWSDGDETLARNFNFEITQLENFWTIQPSVTGWTYQYGVPGDPQLQYGAAAGNVTVSYHAYGSSVYFNDISEKNAGSYAAKFEVIGTDDYSGLSIEIGFTIKQATLDMRNVAWDYDTPFVYDGNAKTVAVTGLPAEFTDRPAVFKANYTNATGNVEQGSYRAIVTFDYDSVNYAPLYAKDEFDQIIFKNYCDYVIDPCPVRIVWTAQNSYEYTGSALTAPTAKCTTVGEDPQDLTLSVTVTVEGNKPFLASGDYTFLGAIENHNYVVTEGAQMQITVAKKAITVPTAGTATYRYTGSYQTYAFASGFDADWMTKSNDERMEVGSQFVTVDLEDKLNTYWADTDFATEAISTYKFEIKKALVTAPTESTETYVYDGTAQTYAFATVGDQGKYSAEGLLRTESGSQTVTVSLVDPSKYCWTNESTAPIEFTFSIAKLAVTAPTPDLTASYVYDKTEKTFAFATAGDTAWFTILNDKKTDADTYEVKVVLKNKVHTYWKGEGESVDDLTFAFTIAKKAVKKPTADATVFTFDGTEKTYKLGNTEDAALYAYPADQMKKTASGITTFKVSLNDAANYRWEGGESSEPIEFTFSIAKLAVTAPTPDLTASYVYDKTEKTFAFATAGDDDWFTVSNNKKTDAGTYEVKVALKNENDTYWKGEEESVDDLTFTFFIDKAEAAAPTASTKSYVYTGAELTYEFATLGDQTLWRTSGALSRTNAGTETITVSLVSPSNYRWKETQNSDSIEFTFTVSPAKVKKPAEDKTKYYCSDATQTYQVALSTLYSVTGNVKKEHGTTPVVISLNDKNNYVWEDETTADFSYDFTIDHDFKYEIATKDYLVSDEDCTLFYKACVCGEKGTETYHKGDHKYVVEFDWVKMTVNGSDSYTVAYANVSCANCKHSDRIKADITVEVSKVKRVKTYIATVELDRVYSDSREVDLKAAYHEYADPVWDWSTDASGAVTAIATFYCIDEGLEDLKEEVTAEITVRDNGDDTYYYVATAIFNEIDYVDLSEKKTKPTLTFIFGDDATENVSCLVVPGIKNVVDFVPDVPTRADGAVFLKWWEEEERISLLYTQSGFTFLVRDKDMVFVALWKNVGQITVTVTDKESAALNGCVVELRRGDDDSPVKSGVTVENGSITFDGLEYGNYSVVVTYTDGNTVTYTTGTILSDEEKTVPVQMSEKRFNTEVNDASGKNVSVENLEDTVSDEEKQDIFTAGQEGDVTEITVVLSVVNEDSAEMVEIIESQNNTVIDLSDITLVKTVKVIDNSGSETTLEPTEIASSDKLVSITFPITDDIYAALAAVHGSVDNVLVARKDGSSVDFMSKYSESEALESEEECYYVTETDGIPYVVVRTKTFSTTYGLCVSGAPVKKDNAIVTFNTFDWTYGEQKKAATATATYGAPVITYQLLGTLDWVTFDNVSAAGTYKVRARVEETEEYKGAESLGTITIAKATYSVDLKFEDLTVVYDSEAHSIVVQGTLPDGVTISYENNGKVEVGEYLIKATFVGNPNYEQIPSMSATLRIVEAKPASSGSRCVWLWILLAIAVVEIALLILLFLRGRKYKKKYEDEKEKQSSMSAILLLGLSRGACLAINIVLLVLDVLLLGLLIWAFLSNRKYKKLWKELVEKGSEAKEDSAQSEEQPSEQANDSPEGTTDPAAEQGGDAADAVPPSDGSNNG